MREQGIGLATTKEIARVAGCSEALLYKNFEDKTRIFLAVLQERSPDLGSVLAGLGDMAGTGTVVGHLQSAAESALEFYGETFPMAAGLFSDRRLLRGHRDAVTQLGAGPHLVNRLLADYLRAEQALGRVALDVDTDAAAALLLGGCLQHAFFTHFAGTTPDEGTASRLVQALCASFLTSD